MEIKSIIGKKFDVVNEVWKDLRRQIEFDRYLKHQTNVKLTYEYYYPPKNPIDFLSKRYILNPPCNSPLSNQASTSPITRVYLFFALLATCIRGR